MPGGRPSSYTPEIGERICELIGSSDRGLDFLCSKHAELPHAGTVHRWLNAHPEFREHYLRARERQADFIADQALEIADDTSRDTIETESGERANAEWISRSKLRVDTRLRIAGKLAPKRWGDRIQHANDPVDPMPAAISIEQLVADVEAAAARGQEK